jgi:hypothetical protein
MSLIQSQKSVSENTNPETLTFFRAPLDCPWGEGATGLNTPLIAQGGRGDVFDHPLNWLRGEGD